MTALDRYVRLESDALWRASPDAQRRDVTLSFGDATLVITDHAGRPLAHWSLPALIRQNPDEMPAIFSPDEDESEALEISDTTMVDAIEEVRDALSRARPQPGKLRYWLTAGLIAVTGLLAVFWLPNALTRQTLAVVPAPKRIEIGAVMLGHIEAQTGPVCGAARANAAATRLARRLFGADTTARIVVVPNMDASALALPGGLIVLDASLLQLSDDPAAAAGFILASRAALTHQNPLEKLLKDAGLGATFRLLTTGEISDSLISTNAQSLLSAEVTHPDRDVLRHLMAEAQIPHAPYRAASDLRSGNTPDLGEDPMAGQPIPPVLNDSDWVSLQNICNS